jgi:hypothetical protein
MSRNGKRINISATPSKICPVCGYKGKTILKLKGRSSIEVFLWILFIIPGLAYSIWRHTDHTYGCPNCISDKMVPICTPIGQKLSEEFSQVTINFKNHF